MFRSVRFFSLETAWPDSEEALSALLAAASFTPCGPLTERSSGWEPPTGNGGAYARRVGNADFIRLRSQTRVLPAAAIDEALESRIEEYRRRMREEPGRRLKRKLKAETRDELLPKALLKSERTAGLCLVPERILAVATASEARAERFVDNLRAALGGLTAKPLAYRRPFADLLRKAFVGEAPGFELGRECRMQDPSDAKGVVRWQNVDLAHSTVRKCVQDGLHLTHLGVELADVLSAVVDANGVVTKLTLAGRDADSRATPAPPPSNEQDSTEDGADEALARLDAELVLLAGALRQLLAAFKKALGGRD